MTTTTPQTVADLDGTENAPDWLEVGHALDAYEVAYLRSLRLPDESAPSVQYVTLVLPDATPEQAQALAFTLQHEYLSLAIGSTFPNGSAHVVNDDERPADIQVRA